MDNTTEALKLALPLLEDCVNSYRLKYERPAFDKAITAIKKALAKEQEPWCMKMNGCKTKCEDCPDEPLDICCQQYDTCLKPCTPRAVHLAQRTEQEPVAWRTFDGEGGYDYQTYENNESYADDWNKRNPNHKGWVEPLYTHPPQRTEQEPVAWMTINEYGEEDDIHYENPEGHLLDGWTYKPLYTTPQPVQEESLEPFEYWNAVEGWVKIDEVRKHFGSVGCGTIYKTAGEDRVPLYTAPSQRTWVGLTGEEAMDVTRKEGHELLDFIYEYGTGSEGVEERIVAICKAIESKLKEKNT